VTLLVVVRAPAGHALDFRLTSFPDVIPPGLAKQVSLNNLYIQGYAEPLDVKKYVAERLGPAPLQGRGENYSDFLRRFNEYSQRHQELSKEAPGYSRKGEVEFRILDFRTTTPATATEQLLK